jgi:site-specific DNA recombinase
VDKLCGLYVRVSTERQAELRDGSLDTQTDRLKHYVKFRSDSNDGNSAKWKLIHVYREEGKSGKNTERPALQKLLSDLRESKINTILCTKIDRITRSLIDFYKLNDTFKKYNVDFISLEEGFDTSTPMGQAMLKMTLVWAELEREQTSKRTKDKLLWRAQQGLWNGGHVLGYDLVDKKLVVNKQEAKLVNHIFEKYLEKGSVLKVVEYLNDHGYRTKQYVSRRRETHKGGSAFYNQYILHILSNHLYLGEIAQHGKIYKGQHEPIVKKELWHEVNQKIKLQAPRRTNPKREVKHVFLLQGLLKCGWCGSYMSTKYSTGRNGLCYYYQCTQNARRGKNACQMKYVPAAQLEKVVLAELKKIGSDKQRIQKIVDEANKDTHTIFNSLRKAKKNQETKLTGVKGKIKNLLHNISAHSGLKNSKSVMEELTDLETQKDQIEKDIQNIDFEIGQVQQQTMSARVMYESLAKFNQIYEVAEPAEIKELLPLFVERVTWKPSEIEIALFEQEAQKGQFPPTDTTSSGGALEVKKWLPRLGSNQGQSGYDLTSVA